MATTTHRWIVHADMDAFYASIEQRDDPSLRGKPVIVGATSPRGVVAAASYEARVHGVRSAMPGFRARALCPEGIFLPSDMERYGRVSDQVRAVFEQFTPEVQPIALDEAFLDVTGSVGLFEDPIRLGRALKGAVRRAVDLPISVGIATNKLVAKIACTLSKPDGLIFVPPEAVTWLLWPMPVRRLWGVGPVTEQALEKIGVRTIGQLARCPLPSLRPVLGDRADGLVRLANGIDDRSVEAHLAPKSYGEENTFAVDVSDRETVVQTLTAHAEAVARRLRRDGYRGRTVTLKIKLARARGSRVSRGPEAEREPSYPILSRSRTLETATSNGGRIRDIAVRLWDAAGVAEPVRLLGVSVSGLSQGRYEQLDLFSRERRGDRLGPALDAINARFGRGTISRAVAEPGKITHSSKRKRGEE